jgi:hypothetical protein
MLRRCGADQHAGARTDAVEDLARHVVLHRHAEGFVEEAIVKGRDAATSRTVS